MRIRRLSATRYEIIPSDAEESLSARDAADLLADSGRIGYGSVVTWLGGHLYDVECDIVRQEAPDAR